MRKVLRYLVGAGEEAAARIEYVFLVAFIALAAIVGMQSLGAASQDGIEKTAEAVESAGKGNNGNHGTGNNGQGNGNQ